MNKIIIDNNKLTIIIEDIINTKYTKLKSVQAKFTCIGIISMLINLIIDNNGELTIKYEELQKKLNINSRNTLSKYLGILPFLSKYIKTENQSIKLPNNEFFSTGTKYSLKKSIFSEQIIISTKDNNLKINNLAHFKALSIQMFSNGCTNFFPENEILKLSDAQKFVHLNNIILNILYYLSNSFTLFSDLINEKSLDPKKENEIKDLDNLITKSNKRWQLRCHHYLNACSPSSHALGSFNFFSKEENKLFLNSVKTLKTFLFEPLDISAESVQTVLKFYYMHNPDIITYSITLKQNIYIALENCKITPYTLIIYAWLLQFRNGFTYIYPKRKKVLEGVYFRGNIGLIRFLQNIEEVIRVVNLDLQNQGKHLISLYNSLSTKIKEQLNLENLFNYWQLYAFSVNQHLPIVPNLVMEEITEHVVESFNLMPVLRDPRIFLKDNYTKFEKPEKNKSELEEINV